MRRRSLELVDPWFEELKAEIRARVAPQCSHFSPEDLEELVQDLARLTRSYVLEAQGRRSP